MISKGQYIRHLPYFCTVADVTEDILCASGVAGTAPGALVDISVLHITMLFILFIFSDISDIFCSTSFILFYFLQTALYILQDIYYFVVL